MSTGDIIVLAILAAVVGRALYGIYRKRGACGCGTCTDSCSGACGNCAAACGRAQKDKKPER